MDLETGARRVLEAAWEDERGYCFPHRDVYPHQWLWDSCFHAIAWSAFGDVRGRRELEGVFALRLEDGMVPHMRYAGPTISRGPLANASSFTQPPVFAHAAAVLGYAGKAHVLWTQVAAGLDFLWSYRRTADGLLYIVHPWESGADDSPRWDSWVGTSAWDRQRWGAFDRAVLAATEYSEAGSARMNGIFEAAPAAFNAIAAHAAAELASSTGDETWQARGHELAVAVDELLWDEDEALWSDAAITGGGASVAVPTLDGVLGALGTDDADKAARALHQLSDPDRFAAPYGATFVARRHPVYDPAGYWRGSSWPQLNYLTWVALRRWGAEEGAVRLARASRQGAVTSGFSEHWNPETGAAAGATPQTWAAITAAMTGDR